MSTTALRASKSPLTPKLAGSYSSQPQNYKQTRPASFTPDLSSPPDISVTDPSLLNDNVTPRSGSRVFRRDAFTSPSETSSGAQHGSRNHPQSNTNYGLQSELSAIRDGHKSPRGRAIYNGTQSSASTSRSGSPYGSSVGGPMFFHADAAKSPTPSQETDLNETPPPKFLTPTPAAYTDKTAEESSGSGRYSWKNGSLSKRPGAGHGPTLAKAPELFNLPDGQQLGSLPREPVVAGQRDHRRRSSQSTRPPNSNMPQSQSSADLHSRPPLSSPQTTPRSRHTRSRTADVSSSPRQLNPLLTSPPPYPANPAWDSASQTNGNSPDPSPRNESDKRPPPAEMAHPFPRAPSPPKGDQSSNNGFFKMMETSTSARTERKVLDLEISNSSLLAINRTLEREMRKQSAELRRFRRLSRSGRLSMASSHRSASGGLSVVSETDDAQSDHSPAEPDSTDSDDSASLVSDEGSTSPSSVTDQDTHPRARDEKHLLHDLSKHQQLLTAGQNMNQSIKRCLGRTENLIVEAKKALEYDVHVNDVNVGGRVLSPDEVEGDSLGNQALLSPTADLPPLPDWNDSHELASPGPGEEVTIPSPSVAEQP